MNLFCYGTLMHEAIIGTILGRQPSHLSATLTGFEIYSVKSTAYPAIQPRSQGSVIGLVYSGLTAAELLMLDKYEGDEYLRCQCTPTVADSSITAWTYVYKDVYRSRLGTRGWDFNRFVEQHLDDYLQTMGH